mmetsp:Transcript_16992/g.22089  ORF Transcript_16992/g.22089 Transcript_16992/m.22089 type:complete len:91 (+) Transcript_16992:3896-4168(+)
MTFQRKAPQLSSRWIQTAAVMKELELPKQKKLLQPQARSISLPLILRMMIKAAHVLLQQKKKAEAPAPAPSTQTADKVVFSDSSDDELID